MKSMLVFAAALVIVLLVFAARHHSPTRRKIARIWHGRVSWEEESNTPRETSRNTCVVSVITGPKFAQFSKRLIDNKQQYCAKMGFQCHIFKDSIVTEYRPLAWQKVHAIDTVLAMGNCHRLLWLDGDAIIMQPVKLPETTCNIALTKDSNGINTGVMIIKNTEWSDHFFHRVANTTAFDYHPWWEQAAIIHFIETEPWLFEKHIEYISQDIYNSYDINRTPFIYHTAGCGSHCFHKWETAFNKITDWRTMLRTSVRVVV